MSQPTPEKARRGAKNRSDIRKPDTWLALLAGLGVILSAYLLITRAAHAPVYCPLGTGCDIVQSSRYAAVFGIPIALLGLAYYAAVLVLGLRPMRDERRWALAMPPAGAGVGASAVFTVVQQAVIHATCTLCVLSALLSLAMLLYLVLRRPPRLRAATWGWASAGLVAAVAFLAIGYAASAPRAADTSYAAGLARHLAASGVTFYGAYWCPHCADQKAMFGRAAGLLPYVECDPGSPIGRPQVCEAAGIRAFPTWDIKGQRYEGVLSLEDLARLTGYPPPP